MIKGKMNYLKFNERFMMKNFSLFSIIILIFSAFSFAEEIVLQNGDDYSGCEDTYISDDDWQNDNFGDETMTSLQGYH